MFVTRSTWARLYSEYCVEVTQIVIVTQIFILLDTRMILHIKNVQPHNGDDNHHDVVKHWCLNYVVQSSDEVSASARPPNVYTVYSLQLGSIHRFRTFRTLKFHAKIYDENFKRTWAQALVRFPLPFELS